MEDILSESDSEKETIIKYTRMPCIGLRRINDSDSSDQEEYHKKDNDGFTDLFIECFDLKKFISSEGFSAYMLNVRIGSDVLLYKLCSKSTEMIDLLCESEKIKDYVFKTHPEVGICLMIYLIDFHDNFIYILDRYDMTYIFKCKKDDKTLLHYALRNKDCATAMMKSKYINKYQYDIENHQNSPIKMAISYKYRDIFKQMLKDIDIEDFEKHVGYDIVIENEMINIMIENGKYTPNKLIFEDIDDDMIKPLLKDIDISDIEFISKFVSVHNDYIINHIDEIIHICQDQKLNPKLILKRIMIKSYAEKNTCSICCDKDIKIALSCGHTCCTDCSKKLNFCPVCRTSIRDRMMIYI